MIIFIIGPTASGKTNLSLKLAQQVNGEIISADSMQVYKNADIMTAKATKSEQAIAKHHLIDILQLHQNTFNRVQYQNQALQIISQIQSDNKVPIVVGGTNYYIESLLFED